MEKEKYRKQNQQTSMQAKFPNNQQIRPRTCELGLGTMQ